MAQSSVEPKKLTWKDTLRSLRQPKVAAMLGLGFSSGLPFMLVGNTLGYWLRESGIDLATIGFAAWVGLAYSFKFLWAPLIDKVNAPLVGAWLGRRRGWMFITQITIMVALIGMSILKPESSLGAFIALSALAAIGSSTQDIVVDAWRIEVSENSEEMALLSSSYQLGYRASLLITDSLILILAASIGWPVSYLTMGFAMAVGMCATLFAKEPARTAVIQKEVTSGILTRVYDAIAGPFISFFKQYGKETLLILMAVSVYRLSDFVLGPMANPFYADVGISKETVGVVRGSIGLIASLLGIAAGGLSAVRLGFQKTLLIGAVIGPASNLGFSFLAVTGPQMAVFSTAMAIDNFATGFAGVALVGYMSSLTTLGYTATQYALLSSFYTLLGKFLKGFSGVAIEKLSVSHDLMTSYALYFLGTALMGIPALLLCILVVRRRSPKR